MSATLPPELRAHMLERVRARPVPSRAATLRRQVLGVVLGAAVAVVLLAALGFSLGGRPVTFFVLSGIGWAALALAATWGAVGRGGSMLGRARIALVIVATLTAPAIYAWVMGCTLGWPGVRATSAPWAANIACLVATTVFSLGPLAGFALVRLRSDPVHPRLTGAAIGAAAGAWGGVLIDMHCGNVHPFHVAFGHVMPVLVYVALGALLGRRLFGVR